MKQVQNYEKNPFQLYWKAKGMPQEVRRGDVLLPTVDIDFTCPLCRCEASTGVTWKKINLSIFTNWDWFADDTPFLCLACSSTIKDDLLKRRDVIITEDKVLYFQKKNLEDRVAIMDFIFSPPSVPFVVSIPSSYKKHIVPRAIVNVSRKHVAVQYEEETIWVDVERDKPVFETIKLLRQNKVANIQIEQVSFITTKIKKLLPEEDLLLYKEQLEPYRGTAILRFLITMAKPD